MSLEDGKCYRIVNAKAQTVIDLSGSDDESSKCSQIYGVLLLIQLHVYVVIGFTWNDGDNQKVLHDPKRSTLTLMLPVCSGSPNGLMVIGLSGTFTTTASSV